MKKTQIFSVRDVVLFVLLISVSACSDNSSLDDLQGRWVGEIICLGGTNDFSMVLRVSGDHISGDGFTTTNNSDKTWQVSGTHSAVTRDLPCLDDTCVDDAQCNEKGGDQCSDRGICLNCTEPRAVKLLALQLIDENIQITDPLVEVEQAGAFRLEGTVSGFCPDEERQEPSVTLTKE